VSREDAGSRLGEQVLLPNDGCDVRNLLEWTYGDKSIKPHQQQHFERFCLFALSLVFTQIIMNVARRSFTML
jgi:hypothetical protein